MDELLIENLKCCANCDRSNTKECDKFNLLLQDAVCDDWKYDDLILEDRKKWVKE